MQKQRHSTELKKADADEEFRDFAYIVSHDLAGPVRSMVSFSQILKERLTTLESEEDRLHLDLVIESGQKLGEMIQGLLAFSRLNTVPRAPHLIDLEIVVARCYMEIEPALDVLKGHFNYPRMPEIIADSTRMFTLFHALLDNASSSIVRTRRRISASRCRTAATTIPSPSRTTASASIRCFMTTSFVPCANCTPTKPIPASAWG